MVRKQKRKSEPGRREAKKAPDDEKTPGKTPEKTPIDDIKISECVECRLIVRYDGWDGLSWKTKPVVYNTTQVPALPLFVDQRTLFGRVIQQKKLSYIELQARVKTEDAPCNCKATVDGKIIHALADIDWSTWSFSPERLGDALKDLGLDDIPTDAYDASELIHKVGLKSFEAQIKRFGRETDRKGIDITCRWAALVGVFDLGARPTTRGVTGEVRENGDLICRISLQFQNL